MSEQNAENALLGAWRLVSIKVRMEDTSETFDVYGPDPRGTAIFSQQGRMAIVISASGRPVPKEDVDVAGAFRQMMAYAGNYRIEGDMILNDVDVAWHPGWEGSQQPRQFALNGDELTLTSPVGTHPLYAGRLLRGIVVWRRQT